MYLSVSVLFPTNKNILKSYSHLPKRGIKEGTHILIKIVLV